MSARDRILAGFKTAAPVKLNTEKRDVRTIEEIERDMRLRKAGEAKTAPGGSRGAGAQSASKGKAPANGSELKRKGAPVSEPSPKRPKIMADERGGKTSIQTQTKQKDRRASTSRSTDSQSETDSDSETDSESDDSRDRSRRHRRHRSGLDKLQKDTIWSIMGRDRARDLARDALSDDDDDMEVSAAQIQQEERLA